MNSGIIRNAILCDGSGKEPFPADLRFENGIITETGSCKKRDLMEFDADGAILAPGFIDIHAHSDLSILAEPEAFGKISQGVTTEVSGNCGLSPFPVLTDEVREHLEHLYRRYNVPVVWRDLSGYLSAVQQEHPSVNVAAFCGYNTLRANFTGYGDSPITDDQIRKMKESLSLMLEQGAAGLSTGLLYVPGKFASEKEICTVASALLGSGKPVSTHLRSEGKYLLEAVREAIRIAEAADNRLQISHLKTASQENWHKISGLLSLIRSGRDRGLSITADRYPYTYSQTSLSVILPPPWDVMTDSAITEILRGNPEKQSSLIQELKSAPPAWDRIILCSTGCDAAAKFSGKPFLEVCGELSMPPEELCVRLMTVDAPGTMAAFGGLSPENLEQILLEPYVCCGTDESARPADFSIGQSHPRGFGSFPRFFQYVSEKQGIGEAVRKMTALPAEICNLSGRGLLKPGYFADMVLFKKEHYRDRATFREPHSSAEGVSMVFVNGVLSFTSGTVTGKAGNALRIQTLR